jgi:serine/threonine protein kinase
MSLCINPRCPQPNHPDNDTSLTCCACGAELTLQGRYRVMRLMSSQSGFGWVYEAYERNLPKILKVLKQEYNGNEKVLELFRREAQVLSQLDHPGVPRVESDGYFQVHLPDNPHPLHCLVMEKIDGLNLKQWMVQQGNHPISEKQALLWLTQITDVLHRVHQHNYFHRDIKPENIMLRSTGQLVLVDFGAARQITQTYMAQLGDSGITAVSSAGYTPPEQEQGQAVPQSDFYALGRTLIYLLTAKMPNDPAIYDSRTNAFNWRSLATHISPSLADLVDDLIAPAAKDRPQTTEIILERLGKIRAGQVTQPPARPTTPNAWPETTLNPHEVQTQPDPLPLQKSFLKLKQPWVLAILLGLAALAYGMVGQGRLPGLRQAQVAENSEALTSVPEYQVSEYRSLPGHTADVKDMLLLKDGQTLVTSSADETIRLWNLQTGAEIQRWSGHDSSVNALTRTTDQNTLITAGADRRINFWTLPEGEPIDQIEEAHGSSINALAVSNNGQWLASGDSSGVIKLWDLSTLEVMDTLTAENIGTINHLRFTRDDAYLASGGKKLMMWDMANPAVPIPLEGHTSFINRLEVSDDNQILVSASADKTVRLWDIPTQTWNATLQGHESYVNDVMIDGPRLWSADEAKTILVWDLNQETPVRELTGFDTDIWRFAVQPNDRIVTVGGDRHNVTISIPDLEPTEN